MAVSAFNVLPPQLKRDLFEIHPELQRFIQFDKCEQLTAVDIVGGTHKTIASLHMESWRAEMIAEINRINQSLFLTHLPITRPKKYDNGWNWFLIKWIINKAEHYRYVKEGVSLLHRTSSMEGQTW